MKSLFVTAFAALLSLFSPAHAGELAENPTQNPHLSGSAQVWFFDRYVSDGTVYYADPVIQYQMDVNFALTEEFTLNLAIWESYSLDGGKNFGRETDAIVNLLYKHEEWTLAAGYAYFYALPMDSSVGDVQRWRLSLTSPTTEVCDRISVSDFAEVKYYVPATGKNPERGWIGTIGTNITAEVTDRWSATLTPSLIFDGGPFGNPSQLIPAVSAALNYKVCDHFTVGLNAAKWFPSKGTERDVTVLGLQLSVQF